MFGWENLEKLKKKNLILSKIEDRWRTSYILVYILTPGAANDINHLSASKLGDEN